MIRRTNRCALALVASIAGATSVSAHMPLQPPGSARNTIQAALNVDSRSFALSGAGSCNYSDAAQVEKARGDMWSLHGQQRDRSVTLTLWRTSSGAERFRLRVVEAGRVHYVNTMGAGAELRGTGRAIIEPRGRGGVFAVEATADTGVRISGQLTCSLFTKNA
jgi:hypothetical protein